MLRIGWVLLAAAADLTATAPAQASLSDGVRVTKGVETAMVRRNHFMPWKRIGPGGHVPPLAEVSCEKPCTVAVDADNTMILTPGAVIAVDEYFYVPLVPDTQQLKAAHQVELREGLAEAVSPTPQSLPLVVTVGPNEHIALRGARVQIAHRADHAAASVLAGTARAGAARSWITLETNQTTTLITHQRPRGPVATVEIPKWSTAADSCDVTPLTLSDRGEDANVGACWEAATRAVSYQVELAHDAEFQQPIGGVESTERRSYLRPLPVGRYFLRVRSIDADGLSSALSTVRKMAVIPLGLPPGSHSNPMTKQVVVPEGREITFGQADDLEVATDQGGFVKAPSSLRMDSSPVHDLRIRMKEDPSSVGMVHIVRRTLRAEVRLSPRKARWPSDPIDIAVTIEDPTGQTDPEKVEPELHVLLGLQELQLDWTHRGAVWAARVAPRRMGGPAVLRVIASDEHGTPLGRNFIEIDGAAPRGAVELVPGWRLAHQ